MVFLVTGLVLGLYWAGIEFDRNALLVAFVVLAYGELIHWRLKQLVEGDPEPEESQP